MDAFIYSEQIFFLRVTNIFSMFNNFFKSSTSTMSIPYLHLSHAELSKKSTNFHFQRTMSPKNGRIYIVQIIYVR